MRPKTRGRGTTAAVMPAAIRRSDDRLLDLGTRRYCRTREVLARLGITRVTLWEWRRRGVFPAAQRLGPNTIAWPEDVIEDWMASRPKA